LQGLPNREQNLKLRDKNSKAGFSLVELLLTLVLILCLAAASVFTFTAMYRSANLDEGYNRFQSLIRFAQAEAATTGRKVRLQFEPVTSETGDEEQPELRNIKITWEADLLNAPGVFQTYTNKSWSEDIVNELVGVEKVQAAPSGTPIRPATPVATANGSYDSMSRLGNELAPVTGPSDNGGYASSESASPDAALSQAGEFPSITFYPDGSCDSAEIVLASRNTEDARRVEVSLSGILGSVSSRTISPNDSDEAVMEDPFDEFAAPDPSEASDPLSDSDASPESYAFTQ
jgi:prepilin-type N-terminal cleavage/methylation domain-containing protein